jgi:hypothetical protein
MYVGGIAGLMSSKKLSAPCISHPQFASLSMMISQLSGDLTFNKKQKLLYSGDCFVFKIFQVEVDSRKISESPSSGKNTNRGNNSKMLGF